MKKILRSILVCAAMIITFSWNTNCVKAEDSIEIYNGVKYRVNNEQKWASVCGYSGDAEDLEIPFMVGRGIIVSQTDAQVLRSLQFRILLLRLEICHLSVWIICRLLYLQHEELILL